MRRRLRRVPRALLLSAPWLLALTLTASAQPTQQLSGVVRDATSSVSPGVTVTVTGAALAASRVVMTDQQGRYELELPAGRYSITATRSDFQTATADISVGAAGPATLDLVLAVSPLSEPLTSRRRRSR
jgi:hypothetical protein